MRSHFHRQEWLGGLPVAQSWNVLVKPMVSLRACGARPSARWPSDGDKALRGQSGGRREGRFSRRDALCASALQGLARATAFHRATWVAGWPWPNGDMPRSNRCLPPGVGSPPLPGIRDPSWDDLAGKGPRSWGEWFSRRDAPCASIWRGLEHAKGSFGV